MEVFFSACGSRLQACEKAFESVLDSVGIVSERLGDNVEKRSPNYSSAKAFSRCPFKHLELLLWLDGLFKRVIL
mgnify:CR=1 FL=1